MQKIEMTKRDLVFLGALSVAAAVFTVIWMALTGNGSQVYKDIVIEWTALVRSNKGAEILLLRLLIVLGSLAAGWFALFRKNQPLKNSEEKNIDAAVSLAAWICAVIVLKFLFLQQVSHIFLFALCFLGIAFIVERKVCVSTLCLYFFSYYAVFALYHAFNFLGSYKIVKSFAGMKNYASVLPLVFDILCTGIPLFFKGRKILQKRMVLLVQLVLPALFLILSLKEYNDHGNIVLIGIPLQAKIFVALCVLLCFFDASRLLKREWKSDGFEASGFISIGSCIAIMCFNAYGGQGAVVSADLHHPFENIFAFQQIFELGQIPYRDFIPPSGLYSVVQGAFFWLFGNGDVAHYALTNNIFYFTVIASILFLLQFHVKKIYCLALALFLQMPGYNRVAFVAPIVMLLLLPRLVKNANLWLKVFLLVSVFHGLYYPVYGVAVFVGFIPMAVFQVQKIILDKAKPYKTVRFWISWAVVAIVLFASIPLLWGTFVHILAMSGQSVLADGISIFGQELPGWFMPYARNIFRYPVYNAMHIVPLSLMVWIPVLFLCKAVKTCGGKAGFFEHIELYTAILSLIFIPIVSYTFSFIRVDMFTLFARSWSALFGVFILYMVFCAKYVKSSAFGLLSLILLSVLIVPSRGIGVDSSEWKLFPRFGVPDGYVLVRDFEADTVGKCFVRNDYLGSLDWAKNQLSEVGGDASFSKLGNFGHYYVFKQKGAANIESYVAKGFGAAKETKNMLLKKGAVLGGVDPLTTYYLYNWILSSGDYVWSSERNVFVPTGGGVDFAEVKRRNLTAPVFREDYDEGNAADVFGQSFKSLKKIFTKKDVEFKSSIENNVLLLDFPQPVSGKETDFLYIEFDGFENEYMTTEFNMGGEHPKNQSALISKLFLKEKPNPDVQVYVHFYDENNQRHAVRANFGKGRLLINLGVGSKWLLEGHSRLEISLWKNGNIIILPEFKKIELLKCRQI